MAYDNEVSTENLCDFIFNELEEAFFELMDDFKKLKLKNNKLNEKVLVLSNKEEKFSSEHEKLTQEINSLKNQNLELNNEKNSLSKENLFLKDELKKVKPFVEKFTYSSEKLNMLLNNQRAVFNKAGLGYNSQKKQKFFKNFFTPASTAITCFICKKLGHKSYSCSQRKSITMNKFGFQKEPL